MATTSITVQSGMGYSFVDTVYVNIGTSVTVNVTATASDTHWGEVTQSGLARATGQSIYGISGSSWTSSGVTSAAHGSFEKASFFSPYIHQDGTSATHSAQVKFSVPNPIMGSAAGNNASAPNVTVTVGATAMHISTGTLEYSKDNVNWQTSNLFSQARGSTVTYYARLKDDRWGNFGAVASAGSSTPASANSYIGYISPTANRSLTVGSTSIAATATTFSAALSAFTTGDTYYLTTSSTTFSYSNMVARTVIGNALGSYVFLNAPAGSPQNTTAITTDATEASSKTYYLWIERNSAQGGNSSVRVRATGTHNSITVSKSGAAFTITFKDHGANATNEYYDNSSTDTNNTTFGTTNNDGSTAVSIRHRVSVENLNSSYKYGISSSSTSYTRATIGNTTEWKTPDSNGAAQILAATASRPSVGTTQTFYVWRASDTSGSNAAYTNKSYTRKLVDASAAGFPYTNVNLAAGATSVDIVITNTFQGHFYSLWNASSGGAIQTGTVNGNAGSTTISLSNGLPSSGTATFYLFAKTFASRLSGDVHQYTGNSVTVTRLSGDGSSTPAGPLSGTYGAEFKNASGNTILDSATSPIRRVLGSSSPVTVAAATNGGVTPGSTTVNVTANLFASNASDYLIVLTPLGAVAGAQYSSSPYYAVKSTSSFAIKNTTDSSLNFDWEIFKK